MWPTCDWLCEVTRTSSPSDANVCWPVHQEILKIVNPTLVLAYGNSAKSPYSFLKTKYGTREQTFPSGHGDWECRAFRADSGFWVVGLPHLSRYDITGHPPVVDWIKGLPGALPGAMPLAALRGAEDHRS